MFGDNPYVARLASAIDYPAAKVLTRGTHRTNSPEDTLARVQPHAHQMGITRLGNVTGLDRVGIPVAIAVRPNARSFAVSQGKGLDLLQALASAAMEAVELFHGESIAGIKMASLDELSAEACVITPRSLAASRDSFPKELKIAWSKGYDLVQREACWVPWEIVHTDYTLPSSHTGGLFPSGTDGLASGNHLLEAISAGICELIERDAVALWHARSIHKRAACSLNVSSVDDRDCRELLARYERAHVTPRLWDVTSDIGVGAFVCDLPAEADHPFGLRRFRGAGCHPNRAIALVRALTEAAQIRLTYINGIRDDLPSSDYQESPQQKMGAALLDAVSSSAVPRSFADVPTFDENDLALDLRWELERLRSIGVERVVAVDLTRPDIGIPVVRMVIPDLECACTHSNYVPGPRAKRASYAE
jgi:YcaO-like protein with predicted kinase domain